MENKCSQDNHDMLTMKAGNSFQCVMIIRLPGPSSGSYRLYVGKSGTPRPTMCRSRAIPPIPVAATIGSSIRFRL
jgi:hypothetical protein